jgi:hypothetical protein
VSISNDVRSYADSALEQGKQVIDQAATRALATCAGLRSRGEALYGQVSTLPVVQQVSATVEQIYADVKKNDQVAKVLGVAEQAAGAVIETVNERVVNPVKALIDREPGTGPAAGASPAKQSSTATSTAASTAKTVPAKRPPARRSTKP